MLLKYWWYIEATLFFLVLVWIIALAVMGCGPSAQPPTETCVTLVY